MQRQLLWQYASRERDSLGGRISSQESRSGGDVREIDVAPTSSNSGVVLPTSKHSQTRCPSVYGLSQGEARTDAKERSVAADSRTAANPTGRAELCPIAVEARPALFGQPAPPTSSRSTSAGNSSDADDGEMLLVLLGSMSPLPALRRPVRV